GAYNDDIVFHPKTPLAGEMLKPGGPLWRCRILGRPRGPVNVGNLAVRPENWPFFGISARDAATPSEFTAPPQNGGRH
ncbi:MAG TPA: hypothetical protein VIV09_17100, partial [Pseudolabrys sp.]